MLVTGLADDAAALIFVLHHVLADGIGGLAVLARLVDQPHRPAEPLPNNFPAPAPSWAMLVADARGERRAALSRLGRTILGLRTSLSGAGGWHAPAAAPCSLIARTGPGRRLAVAHADLGALRKAAHRQNGTVNDALLAAVAGALGALLQRRGERVGTLRVTVPVAARKAPTGAVQGNEVVPWSDCPPAGIHAHVSSGSQRSSGPPAAGSPGPRWWSCWALCSRRSPGCGCTGHISITSGGFTRWSATSRGPRRRSASVVSRSVSWSECRWPRAATSRSTSSRCPTGSLTVTIVAEPDLVPDLEELASLLQAELDALTN